MSRVSKPASKGPRSEISYKSELKSAAEEIMSIKSYGTSSIRTTTTTRERLADIERQLMEETVKRKQAEEAIAKLTRNRK